MSESKSSIWQTFAQPSAFTLFIFGFASGLPFLLVGGTLSVWLKDSGVSLESIGLISLAGLAYALKFLWAPLVDHYRLPLLGKLGRRRSWLVFVQAMLGAMLLWMSTLDPRTSLSLFVILTVAAGWAGATQDVVIDAYRIEIAPESAQGALAATYTLGYRLALLVSGALALFLADHLAWSYIYASLAALVFVLLLWTLLSKEPDTPELLHHSGDIWQTLWPSVSEPFKDFFTRYAGITGIALLCFMGLFKISDQMLGVMALPFYLDSGFSKTEIASVSKLFGVWVGIAGAFLGGAAVIRYGTTAMLYLAIALASISNLLYLLLAIFPGNLSLFIAVIGGENISGGFLGAVAVAWLSSLVSRQYTATQYALFSSLVALPGKLLGGFSGFMVTGMGYSGFFILSTFLGIPSLLLLLWLSKKLASQSS